MKKLIILSLFAFSLLVSCTNTEKKSDTKETATETAINPDNVVFLDVNVEGMTCTGCEATINSGISELPGIVEVSSDFESGKTSVRYDSTVTTRKDISAAIKRKGYKVTSMDGETVVEVE